MFNALASRAAALITIGFMAVPVAATAPPVRAKECVGSPQVVQPKSTNASLFVPSDQLIDRAALERAASKDWAPQECKRVGKRMVC